MVVIELGSWMSVIVPMRSGRAQPYAIADIRTRRVGAVLLRTRRVDAVGAVLEKEGDGLLSSIETINRRARWRLACYGKILERVS